MTHSRKQYNSYLKKIMLNIVIVLVQEIDIGYVISKKKVFSNPQEPRHVSLKTRPKLRVTASHYTNTLKRQSNNENNSKQNRMFCT